MLIRLRMICLFILIFLPLNSQLLFADEKSHYEAASQLVEKTFNEEVYRMVGWRFALLALKEEISELWKYPKIQPYSEVIQNLLLEVVSAYLDDDNTKNIAKGISKKIYMEEFTETELREMLTFYRTPLGKKLLSKWPIIYQKQWERETSVQMPHKYIRMLSEKLKDLQEKGVLPNKFQ